MKERPLIIDDQLKAEISVMVRYAAADHYIPGESAEPPGDDPLHVLITDFGYRCVFSFTQMPTGLYRDLSISVLTKGKWPNPFTAYTLAELFGFTGWDKRTIEPSPKSWMIAKDIHFDAIRFAQQVGVDYANNRGPE
jgi:hypothetical protein